MNLKNLSIKLFAALKEPGIKDNIFEKFKDIHGIDETVESYNILEDYGYVECKTRAHQRRQPVRISLTSKGQITDPEKLNFK